MGRFAQLEYAACVLWTKGHYARYSGYGQDCEDDNGDAACDK